MSFPNAAKRGPLKPGSCRRGGGAFCADSPKLSMTKKTVRLGARLRDPEWRRYGYLLMAGKALGLTLVLATIILVSGFIGGGQAHAADAPPVKASDIINPINTFWTLLGAFLVFGMQPGFTLLEAGFCRSRETVNVLMECVFDTCLCGLCYWAWGFAFMFGHGNGLIGWGGGAAGNNWFLLHNAPATYESTGVAFLAFWLFQYAFADTCSTVTSGAMIGRTAWLGDIFYSLGVSGFIYPIIGHWAWGPDGFLNTMGGQNTPSPAVSFSAFLPSLGTSFHDFAGSTVVHTIGGMVALAGAIVLGPRLGRTFKRDGGGPMLPHDLVVGAVGGLILWFGWYGFNPGSTLSAMDYQGIGRVAANTTLAACAAGMSAMFYGYPQSKKWDLGFTVNGFLAGLVAITCPCYWVSPLGAVCIGTVAGVLVVMGVNFMEWLRIDDPIGAVPVHGFCGIWGTLSLGLFACGRFGSAGPTGPDNSSPVTGLLYHSIVDGKAGGFAVLEAQFIGSFTIVCATLAVSFAMMYVLKTIGILRVSEAGEREGLDLHEHGIPAYPEFQLIPSATPHGSGIHPSGTTAVPVAGKASPTSPSAK